MERTVLMKKTISKIEQLPTIHIQEVDDFVEFLIQKTNDEMITKGLQKLSTSGHTCDFLYNEPELYSIIDLKDTSSTNTDLNENDIVISPFVNSMTSENSIPADLNYKKLYSDYLTEKYH